MGLLEMPRKRLKSLEANSCNAWVKEFEKVLMSNSDAYVLYRCHISPGTESGVLKFGFLASDEKGNYKYPEICYDSTRDDLYFNYLAQKFEFRDVNAVLDAMRDLAVKLTDVPVSFSHIFIDMPYRNAIQRVFVREDPDSPGEYALFLTSANVKSMYIYSEALTDGVTDELIVAEWINPKQGE